MAEVSTDREVLGRHGAGARSVRLRFSARGLAGSSAVRNAGTRALILPVTGLASLWTAHLVLQSVGAGALGVITLISTLPALVPFADLGVGAAVANAVGDRLLTCEDRRRVVGVSAFVLLVSGGTLAAVVAAGTELGLPWEAVLGLEPGEVPHLTRDLVIVAVVFGVGLAPGLGYRVLMGSDAYWLAQLVQLVTPLVTLSGTILAVRSRDVDMMIVAPVCGASLAAWVSAPVAARRVGIRLRSVLGAIGRGSAAVRSQVLGTAAPMVVVAVGLPVAFQTDRLVLSHRSTPAALAAYAAVALLYVPALSVVASAGFSLWPRFAAVRHDRHGSRTGYARALIAFTVGGGVTGLAVAVLGPLVTRVWAGRDLGAPSVWFCAGLLLAVQACHVPAAMFLMDPAGLRVQALCVPVMAVVNLTISWRLAPQLGAAGPMLGSAVAVLLCQAVPGMLVVRRAVAPA